MISQRSNFRYTSKQTDNEKSKEENLTDTGAGKTFQD